MSLEAYQQKRDFKITAEPGAKKKRTATGASFVVQKHAAARLHYDFRLEMQGVLKSWAVPKGFPTERGVRRLAVEVEDHPLDYANFEGTIPKGQYGGGTVMVWDAGTYEVVGPSGPDQLRAGKLHVRLQGQKLQGEWTLVRSHRSEEENQWFLLKSGEDAPAITAEQEEHSVLSQRTMVEITDAHLVEWKTGPAKPTAAPKPPAAKKAAAKKPPASKRRKGSTPQFVAPMQALLVAHPPIGENWVYELKWDGYRAIALKDGDEVQLISRNEKDLASDFPEVVDALRALPIERLVLDGEICALDEQGHSHFQLLQARDLAARPPIFYYLFDLLHLEGSDLLSLPLHQRKEALEQLTAEVPPTLRFSSTLPGAVEELIAQVRALKLEGLIAKRRDSTYQPGLRTGDWCKLKFSNQQEFVIAGFTPPKGGRKYLGSILVGYYDDAGQLQFAAKVGSGLKGGCLTELHQKLQARPLGRCPFVNVPRKAGRWSQAMTPADMRQCTWAEPELVCEVQFSNWTEDGSLRHPVFLGLRQDKAPGEVRREVAV